MAAAASAAGALRSLPLPVVAAIGSRGGGRYQTSSTATTVLLLGCDLRFASSSARFASPGKDCHGAVAVRLRELGGKALAAAVCCGDDGDANAHTHSTDDGSMSAADAGRLGLVDELVAAADDGESHPLSAAVAAAREIASKSPGAVAAAK